MSTMTMAEYARHRGITKPSMHKLVKFDRVLITKDGKIDVEISDLLLDSYGNAKNQKKNKSKRGNQPPKGNKRKKTAKWDAREGHPDRERLIENLTNSVDYATARAKLTDYKAQMAKLELEEEEGKLIRTDEVRKMAFECARRVRDRVLAIPDRLAGLLAAEREEGKVREMLVNELRIALEELSM